MGALLGLAFGLGLVLIWHGWSQRYEPRAKPGSVKPTRLRELIAQAGLESVTPRNVTFSCIGAGIVVGGLFWMLTRTVPIGLAFGVFAAYAPVALIRRRAQARQLELRECWPDAVDNLASAVRAGLSLPEAIGQLAARGPLPLRRPFELFSRDYRVTGRFSDSLDALKERLSNPTGDRVVESLRIARDVGGSDLGRVLRTLSAFLRDDVRTRSELETRQGWVVNAARLAVAAPWVLLALISLRSSSVQAFQSTGGFIVLAGGAFSCVLAYRLMMRIGRLPQEERVLR